MLVTERKSSRSEWSWCESRSLDIDHAHVVLQPAPMEATGTFTSSSPHPRRCLRALHPRHVLYPPPQCRRPPGRKDPDQACRWLLLLSARVLLQVCTEETHTCTGWTKIVIRALLIITFSWSVTFCARWNLTSFNLQISRVRVGARHRPGPRRVMAVWPQLRYNLVRNPGGFRLGLDHQNLSSVWCPDGTTFYVFHDP